MTGTTAHPDTQCVIPLLKPFQLLSWRASLSDTHRKAAISEIVYDLKSIEKA